MDVTHATDTPGVSKNEHGDHALGNGPFIKRASNLSPIVSEGLIAAAEEAGIAYTLEADSHTTGTDADAIQSRRAGIATGIVSCPNRHMHSPNESVDLEDLENCARLISTSSRPSMSSRARRRFCGLFAQRFLLHLGDC